MNGKVIGMKFMLEGGHFLAVAVAESDVKRLLSQASAQSSTLSGICLSNGISWVLKAERVFGVHTFDWAAAQQAAHQQAVQQAVGQVGYKGMSGPH